MKVSLRVLNERALCVCARLIIYCVCNADVQDEQMIQTEQIPDPLDESLCACVQHRAACATLNIAC